MRTVTQKSLRQEYEEYVLQRIEEYKEQLSRQQLLAIADEAVRELEMESRDQLVLTEVLMLEHVDRLIVGRLKLPSFRRWREKHLKLRRAQQHPTHWGLDPRTPVLTLARESIGSGIALVIGARATANALLLAAHDMDVLLMDNDLSAVETADHRAMAETLSARIQTMVVTHDGWFPEVHAALVVIDSHTLGADVSETGGGLITRAQERTVTGGSHLIVGGAPAHPDERLAGVARELYRGWRVDNPTGWNSCMVFRKPGTA